MIWIFKDAPEDTKYCPMLFVYIYKSVPIPSDNSAIVKIVRFSVYSLGSNYRVIYKEYSFKDVCMEPETEPETVNCF